MNEGSELAVASAIARRRKAKVESLSYNDKLQLAYKLYLKLVEHGFKSNRRTVQPGLSFEAWKSTPIGPGSFVGGYPDLFTQLLLLSDEVLVESCVHNK